MSGNTRSKIVPILYLQDQTCWKRSESRDQVFFNPIHSGDWCQGTPEAKSFPSYIYFHHTLLHIQIWESTLEYFLHHHVTQKQPFSSTVCDSGPLILQKNLYCVVQRKWLFCKCSKKSLNFSLSPILLLKKSLNRDMPFIGQRC